MSHQSGVPLLLDLRATDGSRHFASFPESASWEQFRQHLAELQGADLSSILADGVNEIWIDFTYCGQQFEVNNQFGEYWFFVQNPQCSEVTLRSVAEHFWTLLIED